MNKGNQKLQQTRQQPEMSNLLKAIITGFFGGIFWSSIGYVAYYLNFTKINPNIILRLLIPHGDWQNKWQGVIITIILLGIVSIGVALLYYITLRRVKGMWAGILYGVALFFIVFYVLNPLFPSVKPFSKIPLNTIITTSCIYILYGVFIGYSISYEEEEYQNAKRNETATVKNN